MLDGTNPEGPRGLRPRPTQSLGAHPPLSLALSPASARGPPAVAAGSRVVDEPFPSTRCAQAPGRPCEPQHPSFNFHSS